MKREGIYFVLDFFFQVNIYFSPVLFFYAAHFIPYHRRTTKVS